MLILTSAEAPRTIAVAMAGLLDCLRTGPEAVPLKEAATKKDEEKAQRSLRGHLDRLWAKRYGTPTDEAVVRSLLRPLAVQALDLRPDGSDLRAVLQDLGVLLDDPGQAPSLWRELELIGQRLAAERSWIRRSNKPTIRSSTTPYAETHLARVVESGEVYGAGS